MNEEAKQLLLDHSCDCCMFKDVSSNLCLKTITTRPKSNVCPGWVKGVYQEQMHETMKHPASAERMKSALDIIKSNIENVHEDMDTVLNVTSVDDMLDRIQRNVEDVIERCRRRY